MTTIPFFRCLIILLLIPLGALAQTKVEVERRVDATDVPAAAREWVSTTYESPHRLRWFYEESSDGRSYEAKLKHRGQWHSVEFGQDGTLQDIEIIIRGRELPETVRQPIRAYFDSTYTQHRIRKIQRQLTGSLSALRQAVQEDRTEPVSERYEIEFYGKNDQEDALWEGLFDHQGQLLKRREIVLRPTDNLTY